MHKNKSFIIITFISLLTAVLFFSQMQMSQAKKNKQDQDEVKTKNEISKKKKKGIETLTPPGRKFYSYPFKVPSSIEAPYNFWKMIYSKYDANSVLIHDTQHLNIIYSIVDVSKVRQDPYLSDEEKRSMRSMLVDGEMDRIRSILLKLHEVDLGTMQTSSLNKEEKRIYDFYQNINETDRFKLAASSERLRSQTAMKEKFMNAVRFSGTYLPQMEEIFNSYGVPVEISRLVFVESMFNLKARSKVGASGLWQFMPDTGRLYVNIDGVVDERNDPILATHAAARLLKANYEALGTWPLAINAYNSGRGTLTKAVEAMGTTDISVIINNYRGGIYGFASRNFYPCFLAALDVANNYYQYFGSIAKEAPMRSENFVMNEPATLGELAQETGLQMEALSNLNPGLREEYLAGEKAIPSGYRINIPKGESTLFAQAMQKINAYRLAAGNTQDSLKLQAKP